MRGRGRDKGRGVGWGEHTPGTLAARVVILIAQDLVSTPPSPPGCLGMRGRGRMGGTYPRNTGSTGGDSDSTGSSINTPITPRMPRYEG